MHRFVPALVITLVLAAVVVAGVLLFSGDGDDEAAPAASTTEVPDGTSTTAPDPDGTTTPGSGDYEPVFEEADCEFDLLGDREPRCGWLVVPEDRTDPEGPEVRLHVAVFESDDPDAPADPIVYLDGGPGGESLAALPFSLEPTWADFLEQRDMIFFDQRGVGLSTPSLKCDEVREYTFETLDDALPADEYVAGEFEALTECHERLAAEDVDFAAYNSATNAADVADLRIALGYDEWNMLGISYGTRLAATVMRDHPEGVRSVILDSAYTPDVDLITEAPANLARALDTLFSGCADDPACAEAYPDLETRLYALMDRLEDDPLESTVRDVFTNERHDVLIDGDVVMGTVFQGLYSSEIIPVLPQMIAELEEGETTTLVLLATNNLANGAFFSYGMNLSVQCNEEAPFTTEAEVVAAAEAEPRLTEFFAAASNIGAPLFDICDLWQAGIAAPLENEPIASGLPALVMAGEYDPITPPAWGELAATTLTDASYVAFPGVGHAASVSGDCPLSVALAFLADPTSPPDTGCIDQMGGPEFVVPGATVAPPIEMIPFEDEVFGITVSGVVPDGWESVGPGVWARQTTMIDQTTIIQQATPGALPADSVVDVLAGQLGFEEDPEPIGTEEHGGRSWERYLGTVDGFSADLAIGSEGTTTGIVVLLSPVDERDALVADVLIPTLDAFTTS